MKELENKKKWVYKESEKKEILLKEKEKELKLN